MNLNVYVIGALTSKPYAFTARSWELTNTESIDFFDAIGSNIRVDTRGAEVMRILPRVNNDINEEWISDKIRFFYDGLKKQRLSVPLIRINNNLEMVSWEVALNKVANLFKQKTSNFIVGDFVDLETQYFLKLLSMRLGSNVYPQDLVRVVNDFKTEYLLNAPITSIEKADLIFLVAVNTRLEAPIINLRLRKRINEGVKIFSFGYNINYSYRVVNIGSDVKSLRSVVEGKHLLSKIILQSGSPFVLLGSSVLQRLDAKYFINILNSIKHYTKSIISVLHLSSSKINSAELNLFNYGYMDFLPNKETYSEGRLLYVIGADNVSISRNPMDFVVYQGHHGDSVASVADIILPSSTPFEKNGIYLNIEGKCQSSKFIFAPPGNARNDWKILKVLSDILLVRFNKVINNIADVHNNVSMFTNLIHYKSNSIFINLNTGVKYSKLFNVPFTSAIGNFYTQDSITRSSYVMALTSKRFNKNINYIL